MFYFIVLSLLLVYYYLFRYFVLFSKIGKDKYLVYIFNIFADK